jgi:hypothetical protein
MEKKDVERELGVIPFPFLMKWGDYKGCPISRGLQFGIHMIVPKVQQIARLLYVSGSLSHKREPRERFPYPHIIQVPLRYGFVRP